ncbi:MAG TPA: hypothetical protein VMG40_18290 [Bryobacteraceae bacterium]|nr:hypothetical protein [Bryobacteraceae bacterium]
MMTIRLLDPSALIATKVRSTSKVAAISPVSGMRTRLVSHFASVRELVLDVMRSDAKNEASARAVNVIFGHTDPTRSMTVRASI